MTPIERALTQGEPPIPWLYELAAVLTDEPPEKMYVDPGTIARSLANAADLFALAAVGAPFDTTIEAEAAGCEIEFTNGRPRVFSGAVETIDDAYDVPLDSIAECGRLPAILDGFERLTGILEETSVLGYVTGPRTLTEQLLAIDDPDDELLEEARFTVGDILSEVANAYLSAGVDGILVLEFDGIRSSDRFAEMAGPLCNVIDHYSGTGIVLADRLVAEDVESAAEAGFDAIIGSVDDPGEPPTGSNVVTGVGVPPETFRAGDAAVAKFVDEIPDGTVISSERTVPTDASPEAVHALMNSL